MKKTKINSYSTHSEVSSGVEKSEIGSEIHPRRPKSHYHLRRPLMSDQVHNLLLFINLVNKLAQSMRYFFSLPTKFLTHRCAADRKGEPDVFLDLNMSTSAKSSAQWVWNLAILIHSALS